MDLKIFTDDIEQQALDQINLLLEQDAFKDCKVRIMPDVHAGAGCVIGFTADLGNKVIPNIVGVDVGCGMTWAKFSAPSIDLEDFDRRIRQSIPMGMNVRDTILHFLDLSQLYCYKELRNKDNYLEKSLGTLGGGNHFIELDKDDDGFYYAVVHSGSRNLGKQVCEIYQNKAIDYCSFKAEMQQDMKETIETLKANGQQTRIQQELANIKLKYEGKLKLPKDLCFIEGEERDNYLHDMRLCQQWASMNRIEMINIIFNILNVTPIEINETIHNYISSDNIVRKGAISAKINEVVLIPMNMRDGCIIAKGKGNEDWNCSAPHGAGRIMSRIEAKKSLDMNKFSNEMSGIYSTSVCEETIDESPMAYKPMQEIIDNIGDTVEIIKIIKPIYNCKAKE